MNFERLQIWNIQCRQPFQFSADVISIVLSWNKIKRIPCNTTKKTFLFKQIRVNTLHLADPLRKTRHNPMSLNVRFTGTPHWRRSQVQKLAHETSPTGNFTAKICVHAHSQEHYRAKAGCPAFLKGANEGFSHLFIWNTRHSVGGMGEISLHFCGLIVCYLKFRLHP